MAPSKFMAYLTQNRREVNKRIQFLEAKKAKRDREIKKNQNEIIENSQNKNCTASLMKSRNGKRKFDEEPKDLGIEEVTQVKRRFIGRENLVMEEINQLSNLFECKLRIM